MNEQSVYFAYLVAFGGGSIGQAVNLDTSLESGDKLPHAAAFAVGVRDREKPPPGAPRPIYDVIECVRRMLAQARPEPP